MKRKKESVIHERLRGKVAKGCNCNVLLISRFVFQQSSAILLLLEGDGVLEAGNAPDVVTARAAAVVAVGAWGPSASVLRR